MTFPVVPSQADGSTAPIVIPSSSPTDDDIRALASQLTAMATPDFTPSALLKGVVVSSDLTVQPSIASITLMGSTTQIDGVLIADNVTAVAGDVVNVTMQGSKIQITGRVSAGAGDNGGWTQATLSSGFTHNGDSQGNVEYRIIQDNGSAKMQWRGAAAVSNSNTTVVTGLATTFRPSIKRKLLGARGMGNGNSLLDIQFEFTTAGAVNIGGGTYSSSLGNSTGELNYHYHPVWNGLDGSATGTYAGSDYDPITGLNGHVHTLGSITYPLPDWVSLNGIEYFL